MPAPYSYDYNQAPFQSAYGYFDQAANAALPSPESLDRAQARVRSRVDTAGKANEMKIRDTYAGRGTLNSGGADQSLRQNMYNTTSALSTGLAQTEDDYSQRRQAGSQILAGIGTGVGQVGKSEGDLGLESYIAPEKLNIENKQVEGNLQNDQLSNLINMLTSMGTVGNARGDANNNDPRLALEFDSNFRTLKNKLFQMLGYPVTPY